MARPRTKNITFTVAMRGQPKFFDHICEKAIKYDGSVAAYIMRLLKEREILDQRKLDRLQRKQLSRNP